MEMHLKMPVDIKMERDQIFEKPFMFYRFHRI